MNTDFNVCPKGTCRAQSGSQSAAIVQRLEDLMRRCREEGHQLTYRDLLEVRNAQSTPAHAGATPTASSTTEDHS